MKLSPFLLLFFLIACTNPQNSESSALFEELPFFNLKAYFNQEAERLNAADLKIEKLITIDEEEERIETQNIEWEKELKIFSDSDINRKDWLHKYTIDSIETGENLIIKYTATNPKLKTRMLSISFNKGEVQKVDIQKGVKSVVNKTEEQLSYFPEKGFTFNRKQKTPFSKEKQYTINTNFK